MNLQLHHVVSDITGATGMRIIRAIIAGERDPAVLASMRDTRCHSSAEVIEKALTGHYRQSICLSWSKRWRSTMCISRGRRLRHPDRVCSQGTHFYSRAQGGCQGRWFGITAAQEPAIDGPDFDVGKALHSLLGKDLTRIHGMGPISRSSSCPNAAMISPHGRARSTSPPGFVWRQVTRYRGARFCRENKTVRKPRCVASAIGRRDHWRSDTALGAFYGDYRPCRKIEAVTATARKIAVLFYNALRHGMDYVDPGHHITRPAIGSGLSKIYIGCQAFGFIFKQQRCGAEQAVS